MKQLNYYAVMYEINKRKLFIVKSNSFPLIENKFRAVTQKCGYYGGSYCHISHRVEIDRLLQENIWVDGAEMYLHSYGERYKVYFHKSKRKFLPELRLPQFNFVSKEPMRDAEGIIKLSQGIPSYGNIYPFKERKISKECQIKLIPIKTEQKALNKKSIFDKVIIFNTEAENNPLPWC